MFEYNPVGRYVFNLDDIRGVAATVATAAESLGEAAGSVRAAGSACAGLPGVGGDVASATASIAGRLTDAAAGLRADSRWLAGTSAKLAAVDAGIWSFAALGRVGKLVKSNRELVDKYGRDASGLRRLGGLAGLGIDLFGRDVTGSLLPATALRYYKGAINLNRVDRAMWRLRYPVAWYGATAADAVRGAAGKATGALKTLVDRRAQTLSAQYERVRRGLDSRRRAGTDWARRLAGDGRGLGRLRRIGNWALPGASVPALVVDGRELFVQRHGYGARGALEVLRDSTATFASALHVGSDALNVVPGAGFVADKGVDVVATAFDGGVMAMDAVDYLAFKKGDDIVHGVADAGGFALDKAGDAIDALGGLL